MNPLSSLTHSRKALIMTTNIFFSVLIMLIGHYLDPKEAQFYLALVALIQPGVLMWIKTIADEDNSIRSNPSVTKIETVQKPPAIIQTTTIGA